MPAIVEHYTERFILSSAATRWDLGLHYNALLSPLMFIGSLSFIKIFKKRKTLINTWAISTTLIVLFLHFFYLHGPLLLATNKIFYDQTKRNSFITPFVEAIPRKGKIMTQNNIAAQIADSDVMLLDLKNFDEKRPDVIALDLHPGQNGNNFFPISYGDAQLLNEKLALDNAYSVKKINEHMLIYTKSVN